LIDTHGYRPNKDETDDTVLETTREMLDKEYGSIVDGDTFDVRRNEPGTRSS
jgi:hypothetical protein